MSASRSSRRACSYWPQDTCSGVKLIRCTYTGYIHFIATTIDIGVVGLTCVVWDSEGAKAFGSGLILRLKSPRVLEHRMLHGLPGDFWRACMQKYQACLGVSHHSTMLNFPTCRHAAEQQNVAKSQERPVMLACLPSPRIQQEPLPGNASSQFLWVTLSAFWRTASSFRTLWGMGIDRIHMDLRRCVCVCVYIYIQGCPVNPY